MRKLDSEELHYFSALITEIKKINHEFIVPDKEIDPYSFILICENLEKAISSYKLKLSVLERPDMIQNGILNLHPKTETIMA